MIGNNQTPNMLFSGFPLFVLQIPCLLIITLVQILHGRESSTLRGNPNIFGSLLGNQIESFPKPFRGGEVMSIKQCVLGQLTTLVSVPQS